MKRQFVLWILLVVLMITSACSSSKLSDEEKKAKEYRIALQVRNRDYTIETSRAIPMRGGSINLSYGYDLKISKDSVYAYLPYYGVVQSAPMGSDGGIRFATLMTDYNITPTKDGWNVRFRIDSREQKHDFMLSIFKNGRSSITVTPLQRDRITYWGEMKL